jgi:thioredoxin-dependent peroxiredoxin
MRHAPFVLLALAAVTSTVAAQQAPVTAAAPSGPNVGDMAPDFSLPAATRYGVLQAPLKLSDLRGQTVVVAFFPKARTSGCTVQLETYRDQYATLFNGGRKVVLVAVSADADTTLAGWARQADFPFVLASDMQGTAGGAYGAWMPQARIDGRHLFVVGPDGRIAYVARPFKVMAQDSYTDLAAAVDKLAPPPTSSADAHSSH